ncbi:hypothetical protein [Polyangium aurulentum]|uniref:hypothetical protein n=1 Tax=Polyangium aurulentum TaxID=2567896 RepID=UPI0010AE4D8B|nr:hypothetical protein [Polyangium aurulentum]UQA62966.1 hypothetical protein E8A73_021915 [Polyangium aurulentum]
MQTDSNGEHCGNAIGRSLYNDLPVNEALPDGNEHRLSKAKMSALRSLSTEMRIDCRGGDYLLTTATNLFAGEGGPSSNFNYAKIAYTEAALKGNKLTNATLCTWFVGPQDGGTGSWHVDEHYQDTCGLPDYPWTGAAITSVDSDLFTTDSASIDTLGHECHMAGAVRHVMLR